MHSYIAPKHNMRRDQLQYEAAVSTCLKQPAHLYLLIDQVIMATEKTKNTQKAKKKATTEAWRMRPIGYPRLSERMGVKPETLIFRKFVALNARVLLYMQAELLELERALQKQEEQDLNDTDGKRSRYASDFSYLLLSHKHGDTTQLELVRKIQGKLELYSKSSNWCWRQYLANMSTR
jgi:hypothetical protein